MSCCGRNHAWGSTAPLVEPPGGLSGEAGPKRPFRPSADDAFPLRGFLSGCLPVWRRVFDLGVEFGTGQDGDTGDIQPEQHDDDAADGAVRALVVREVGNTA